MKRWLLLPLISAIALALPDLVSTSRAGPASETEALHVLNRIGFGPRPGDLERVRRIGIDAYIDEQLRPELVPLPERLSKRLKALRKGDLDQAGIINNWRRIAIAANRDTSPGGPGSPAAIRNAHYRAVAGKFGELRLLPAIESPRQLEEVMVSFWFNHFNVVNTKRVTRFLIDDYETKAIRAHAMGRFRDLLAAITKHPAMLNYLDNWVSAAPGLDVRIPGTRRTVSGLNENFAREIMELHTMGVNGGYTQADVTTLARMLTGWTYTPYNSNGNATFQFASQMHDNSRKVWLGRQVTVTGQAEGEWALDVLSKHPSTAAYISFKLAQYFVSDNPPPALIRRMARQFLDTDGDIRAVLKLMLTSPEFRDPANFGAKFKTPYEYVISSVRASGVEVNNIWPLLIILNRMGMPLYGCGSPDGYKNTREAWLSPETLAQRISFATALAYGRLKLGKPPAESKPTDKSPGDMMSMTMAEGETAEAVSTNETTGEKDSPVEYPVLKKTLRAQTIVSERIILRASNAPGLRAALVLGSPYFMNR